MPEVDAFELEGVVLPPDLRLYARPEKLDHVGVHSWPYLFNHLQHSISETLNALLGFYLVQPLGALPVGELDLKPRFNTVNRYAHPHYSPTTESRRSAELNLVWCTNKPQLSLLSCLRCSYRGFRAKSNWPQPRKAG